MTAKSINNNRGFTLVELMVAMLLSGMVIAAIYITFKAQRESYYVQDEVAAMQQNLRAAMTMMVPEIRMAGYDPTGNATCAAIVQADGPLFHFRLDENGDRDCGETDDDITYGFTSTADDDGGSRDGIADAGADDLGRRDVGGDFLDLAEFIHAIGFAYAYDADDDGDLDVSANGHVIWAVDLGGGGDWDRLDRDDDGDIDADDDTNNDGVISGADINTNAADTGTTIVLADIRAVRIWILARSENQDLDFSNTATYVVGENVITPNDNYRRRLMETAVLCRNMGL